MKKILALNKEEDGLKLIQVNDGFVVVDVNNKDFKKDEDALYKFRKIGVVTDVNENVLKFEGEYIDESHLTKMIFATPNLNLEGVPIIEEKENILDTYKRFAFYQITTTDGMFGSNACGDDAVAPSVKQEAHQSLADG